MTTINEVKAQITAMLSPVVGDGEAKAMASIILEDVKGYRPIDVALYGYRELLPETVERMMKIACRVANGEPLQYVLGTARFRGRNFGVDRSTLIPRPETAQLVDMIVDDYKGMSDLHVLDIGTGSGCIAISLALDLPFSTVDAIDNSAEALSRARLNAANLKAKVNFMHQDILDHPLQPTRPYDIIVSNPPYVMLSEKSQMDARVSEYEPSAALFVPDSNPLLFYKAIAEYSLSALKPGGSLYFEINPLCASQLESMLINLGYDGVSVTRDYLSACRFAKAIRPR